MVALMEEAAQTLSATVFRASVSQISSQARAGWKTLREVFKAPAL
jgi:hypothetical protein